MHLNIGTQQQTTTSTTSSDSTQDSLATQIFAKQLKQIKSLPEPQSEEIARRWVFLGPKTKKYALILDLDETLIWCHEVRAGPNELTTDIQVRPYAKELLATLSSLYELIIYSAAEEDYAQLALKLLDPAQKYVKALVARPYCLPLSKGVLVKDLRIFADRNVDEMLIADNNILSFAFQLANGIPISPYGGREDDDELLFLMRYLQQLYHESDIVQSNQMRFGLC